MVGLYFLFVDHVYVASFACLPAGKYFYLSFVASHSSTGVVAGAMAAKLCHALAGFYSDICVRDLNTSSKLWFSLCKETMLRLFRKDSSKICFLTVSGFDVWSVKADG